MDKMVVQKKKVLKTVLAILLLLLPFIFVLILDYFTLPKLDESAETVAILIPKGASISAIADTLLHKALIQDKELFILWLTTLDKDRALKAGYYEIPRGLNYAQLISFLSMAQAKEIRVTLIEGWQIEQIANELANKLNINSKTFINLAHDTVFIKKFNIKASSLEGYLLPDTYHFYWGLKEEQLLKILTNK